jgi:hypothetical protein
MITKENEMPYVPLPKPLAKAKPKPKPKEESETILHHQPLAKNSKPAKKENNTLLKQAIVRNAEKNNKQ